MIPLRLPTSRTSCTAVVLLTVAAAPTAYLIYFRRSISRHVVVRTGRHPISTTNLPSNSDFAASDAPVGLPAAIPKEVIADATEYVLMYEHVTSHPIASGLLGGVGSKDLASLLTSYLRTTMTAFSRTPQAFMIRAAIADKNEKRTFDQPWIEQLSFAEGDRVDGVYRVAYRGTASSGEGSQRCELMLDAPASYTGPVVTGMIVATVESVAKPDGEDAVVFVNETWFWRKTGDKPVMLESAVGRWLHSLLAGWLVVKGIRAVSADPA